MLAWLVVSVGCTGLVACASSTSGPEDAVDAAEQELSAVACRRTPANAACIVEGTVVEGVIGEIDPFVVGDACILFVRDASGRKLGLVEDIEACTFTSRLGERTNARVSWSKGELRYIANGARRNALKEYDASAVYYDLLGDVTEASAGQASQALNATIDRAISLRNGSDSSLAKRLFASDLPPSVEPKLRAAGQEIGARRIAGLSYRARLEGFYAVYASRTDHTVVAYVAVGHGYAGNAESPDYGDGIAIGFDPSGARVYDRIESF